LANAEDARLPLHVKDVGRVDWLTIDTFVESFGECYDEYVYAKRWTLDPATISAAPRGVPQNADILPADLDKLLSFQYIRRLRSDETPRAFVQLFTAKEKYTDTDGVFAPTRRRLITVPWEINEFNSTVAETRLPNRDDVVAGLAFPGASTFDINAYYAHFPLPTDAQPFYCFTFCGQTFCLLTIPTGGRHCPALAQAISANIRRAVLTASPATHCLAYLDNFRFAGTPSEVECAESAFLTVVKKLGLQCSQDSPFGVVYTFLGIICTHRIGEAMAATQAAPKSLAKLSRSASLVFEQSSPSLRDGLKLLGSLMWISGVTKVTLAQFYLPLKFFRRRACLADADLDDELDLWPCARKPLAAWIHACARNERREYDFSPAERSIVLWTDACQAGYGATMFINAPVPSLYILAGSWTDFGCSSNGGTAPHINLLEACALLIGISLAFHVVDEKNRAHLQIFVDNSTVSHIMGRGYSPIYWANLVVLRAAPLLENFKSHSVSWVSSLQNFADGPSRLDAALLCRVSLAP
jgi:hypothetical protein